MKNTVIGLDAYNHGMYGNANYRKNNAKRTFIKAAAVTAALGAAGVGVYLSLNKGKTEKVHSIFTKAKENVNKIFGGISDLLKERFKSVKKIAKSPVSQKVQKSSSQINNTVVQKAQKEVINTVDKADVVQDIVNETKMPELKPDFIFDKINNPVLKAPRKISRTQIEGLIPEKTSASIEAKEVMQEPLKFLNNIAYDKDMNKFSGIYKIDSAKNRF